MNKYYILDGSSQRGKDIDTGETVIIPPFSTIHQITNRKLRNNLYHMLNTNYIVEIDSSIIDRYFVKPEDKSCLGCDNLEYMSDGSAECIYNCLYARPKCFTIAKENEER